MGICEKIQFNTDFHDIVEYIIDVYEELLDDSKIDKMLKLLQDLNNSTRMQIHRGHTPNEIKKVGIEQGHFSQKPIVVPGSTDAANLLRSASTELEEMGIRVDLDSNSAIIADSPNRRDSFDKAGASVKKNHPNDPCPCGFGKKFKKCCGK